MKSKGIAAILVAICLLAVTVVIIPTQTDHSLSAQVSGTRTLPIIEVSGDDHSDMLLNEDVSSLEKYHSWIAKNITEGKKLPAFDVEGCSAFSVTTSNERFAGRNLDFTYIATTGMIVKNTPYDGYRSISFVSWLSVFEPLETMDEAKNDIRARAAVMLPLDGMNEKGLVCAILVTRNEPVSQSSDDALCSFALIRYLLDHVSTVDEAMEVIEKKGYSNGFVLGGMLGRTIHVFVTDAKGDTLVVESSNDRLFLLKGQNTVTNHSLNDEASTMPTANSLERYAFLKKMVTYLEWKDQCTINNCRDMLKAVSRARDGTSLGQSYTRWSEVYDIENLTIYVWFYCDFNVEPVVLRIKDMY